MLTFCLFSKITLLCHLRFNLRSNKKSIFMSVDSNHSLKWPVVDHSVDSWGETTISFGLLCFLSLSKRSDPLLLNAHMFFHGLNHARLQALEQPTITHKITHHPSVTLRCLQCAAACMPAQALSIYRRLLHSTVRRSGVSQAEGLSFKSCDRLHFPFLSFS